MKRSWPFLLGLLLAFAWQPLADARLVKVAHTEKILSYIETTTINRIDDGLCEFWEKRLLNPENEKYRMFKIEKMRESLSMDGQKETDLNQLSEISYEMALNLLDIKRRRFKILHVQGYKSTGYPIHIWRFTWDESDMPWEPVLPNSSMNSSMRFVAESLGYPL